MAKVRIGFVGVGGMGQCAHLKNYAQLKDICEVVAIAEVRPGLAKKVAQKYDVPKVYCCHEEMLKSEKLDGIVASQPFTRHGTLIPELLKAKVPVFTEKPIAGSIENGEKIIKAMEKSGTWMMIGYHKRSDPATAWAKAEIERLKKSGELGKMKYVRILMPAGDWVASGFTDLIGTDEKCPNFEWDKPASDLSKEMNDIYIGFVNYYIHQVNLMRHLLCEKYDVSFVDPSNVLMAGNSAGGVAWTIEMSPYQTTIDWQESALVCFEKGWIKLELPAPLASNRPGRVSIYKDPGNGIQPTLLEPQLPWVHAMRQQAINFCSAVAGKGQPLCTAEEALEDLKVARKYLKLYKGV